MVVDFSKIDPRERPVLILKNLAGTPIGVLGYASNVSLELCYDETSKLTFDYPQYVDGEKVPFYESLVGMMIVELKDVAQFILVNPSESNTGVKCIKSVTAYSLEYELTYKKIALENSTYNFYNATTPDNTIMQAILDEVPSWHIDNIASSLIGKYRTFEVDDSNVYDFIKSTLQDSYNCIFEFDTLTRGISVRDVSSSVATNPVFISFNNLAKEIKIDEDTENIFTVLDVNGAEDVNIRSVNPIGSNKIYNLDYFMNTNNFSQAAIDTWNNWKTTVEENQLPFYNLIIEQAMKTLELTSEGAELTTLQGELTSLQNIQAVAISALAVATDATRASVQERLTTANINVAAKQAEIAAQQSIIAGINTELGNLNTEIEAIVTQCSLETFFPNAADREMLNRYFKEDSISESSFVAPTTSSYNTSGESSTVTNAVFNISGGNVTKFSKTLADGTSKIIYSVFGGFISSTGGGVEFTSAISSLNIEIKADGSYLCTANLGHGYSTESGTTTEFDSGCISITPIGLESTPGTASCTDDTVVDPDVSSMFYGTAVTLTVTKGRFYFTQSATEYLARMIEWELYEYGKETLSKLAYPSYTFSVDSANFLALEDFISFKNQLELGEKIYLEMRDGLIYTPIVVKIALSYDDPTSFTIEFGDKYSLADSEFQLADLLETSVSMGKTVDYSKYTYSKFTDSGADDTISAFIKSALDVNKNAVVSNNGQAITIDGTGIRLRKWTDSTQTAYDQKQIWMHNNNIMMTSDGWNSAEIAIGQFMDSNENECWGIVAPNIVGTLLAGNNLTIMTPVDSGGHSTFKVDSTGASLYNASFEIAESDTSGTHILLDPTLGMGIGVGGIVTSTENNGTVAKSWNTDNLKFYVDTAGNAVFKGELQAATGSFTGTVTAKDLLDLNGVSMLITEAGVRKIASDYLSAYGLTVTDASGESTLSISQLGDVSITGSIHMSANSTITWSNVEEIGSSNAQKTADEAKSTADTAKTTADDAASKIQKLANGTYTDGTFIDGTSVTSPTINGGHINGAIFSAYANTNEGVFIYDGDGTDGNTGSLIGGLRYGGDSDSKLYLYTTSNNPLKIESGAGLSLYGSSGVFVQPLGGRTVVFSSAYPGSLEIYGTVNLDGTTNIKGNIAIDRSTATVSGIEQLYVQSTIPTGANIKDVWIDTDDYSRYDVYSKSSSSTLLDSEPEVVESSGTITITLPSATAGIVKKIYNIGTGIITISGTINGNTNMYLYPKEGIELIGDGSGWRA